MKVVILGSGNVAFHLANAFSKANVVVSQLFGRNQQELSAISQLSNIPYSTDTLADADLYVIAVSDKSVEQVSSLIQKKDSLVVHTSGSLPYSILQGDYRKGCFYPLQTFSKAKELDYSIIPFLIEAEHPKDRTTLKNLASKISDKVLECDSEKRKYTHLTAVFACNFVNHLYARAKEISDSQNIPFDYFFPLMQETLQKVYTLDPKEAQTGPARRNDIPILNKHRELLCGEPLEIYETINNSIKQMYNLE